MFENILLFQDGHDVYKYNENEVEQFKKYHNQFESISGFEIFKDYFR